MTTWPRSTMDSIRVSEAPDPGSIPGEATQLEFNLEISDLKNLDCFLLNSYFLSSSANRLLRC